MYYVRKITQFPPADKVSGFVDLMKTHSDQCMNTGVPVRSEIEKADEPKLDGTHPVSILLFFKTESDRDEVYPQKAKECELLEKWTQLTRDWPGLPDRKVDIFESSEEDPE